jgi:indolepyruvate ferredoxin oxidoreductase beta subunit
VNQQPLSLLIAALGGEGGGVLADWVVVAARRAGLPVQATSVPGVAQRTGATSYYIEFMPQAASGQHQPVFALMPVPGRVDVLLSSELLETARMIERGFSSPDRTLVISARHRIYTTHEKMQMGDGRFDDERLHQLASSLSRRYLSLDLKALAQTHRTVISAVMFGALAGSGVLPWSREHCEAAIRMGGIGVETSLAGFAAAFNEVVSTPATPSSERTSATSTPTSPLPTLASAMQSPSSALLSDELDTVMALADERLRDYQNADYAQQYRQRMNSLIKASAEVSGGDPQARNAVVLEAARTLAVWMSYEDVIRVADLKTRASRLQRIRQEVAAKDTDIVRIHEHLSPGLDEIAAIAPAALGRWLRKRAHRTHPVGARGEGLTLHTTSVSGFTALRLLGALRWLRPRSLRFTEEQAAIEQWLQALHLGLPHNTAWALSIAMLPQLRKGYSDTWERGVAAYETIFDEKIRPLVQDRRPPSDDDAKTLEDARRAALADPNQSSLHKTLGTPSRNLPAGVHPVHWRPREASRPRPTSV